MQRFREQEMLAVLKQAHFVPPEYEAAGTQEQKLELVHKYALTLLKFHTSVEQVIATSIDYATEKFIEIYESLLAENRPSDGHWCLTLSFPLPRRKADHWQRLAEKAREAGFYEIV